MTKKITKIATILLADCKNSGHQQECDYTEGFICPLARAINKHLKYGYFASVGALGDYDILSGVDGDYKFHHHGTVKNFDAGTVKYATEDFERELLIPAELLK